MSRSRSTLHKNKLEDFREYLKFRGFVLEPTKGDFEVIRARHPLGKEPLIIHGRTAGGDHLTAWGVGLTLTKQYLRDKRIGNWKGVASA